MKKISLITGITGQIGSYLAELLTEQGHEVVGMIRRNSLVNARARIDHIPNLKLIYGDLGDSTSVSNVISEIQPDEIYNLGAQSHVKISFDMPEYTQGINFSGLFRVCEAARRLRKPVRIYQASTSELFGGIYDYPVNEETPFHPKSPYGIAKLAAFWTIVNYREAYNMFCVNGLVFNSESPRRGENFVTRKITKGVADILNKKQEVISLGNINTKRDWNHAEDSARAMWLMLQNEKPQDYVIASGESHSVREFAETAFRYAGINLKWRGSGLEEEGYDAETGKIYIKIDEKYFRPAEVYTLIGDSTKARRQLGWAPKYTFNEIVKEMVDYDLREASIKEPRVS